MQELDWDHLRFVLALSRYGQIAKAARHLGVNETTVSRRIAQLETSLGTRLFQRAGGCLIPTDSGQTVVEQAAQVEAEIQIIRDRLAGADQLVIGKVSLSAVPMLMNHMLIPQVSTLTKRHPRLQLELAADPRNRSLKSREADVAVRMARPEAESGILVRRIANLDYALYAAAGAPRTWILYERSLAHLPHARWLELAAGSDRGSDPPLAVNDSELALNAARCGLGQSLFPCAIGDRFPELRRTSGAEPILTREVWLLVNTDVRRLPRVRAVIDWLEDVLAQQY